jgi:phospholipase C
MLKLSLRLGATVMVVAGLAALPTAAQGTSPPYPVTPYIIGATTATPIQHLIVIFQENVSFDHYFGTYPNALNPPSEPRFHALPDTPVPNNYISHPSLLTDNPNQDSHGVPINPYRLDRSQAVTCDQDHDYNDEQKAFDGNANGTAAAMDKFVVTNNGNSGCASLPPETTDQGAEVMGYFDGNTVTAMWNLANHFAMSDNSFGTTYGPSTPGAFNLVAGQSSNGSNPLATNVVSNNGSGGTCSTAPSSSSTSCAASGNYSTNSNTVVGDPDPLGDGCANPSRTQVQFTSSASGGPLTIGNLLSQQNISWGWFQGGFRPTSVSSTGVPTCGSKHKNNAGNFISDYNPHHEPFQYFPTTANSNHVSVTNPDMIGQNDTLGINHQYDESDFYTALQNNNLPAVTFLKGANYQDGHPGFTESDPLGEQTFVSDVVNAVEQSSSWPSTAIVIMYDDSDGWYDHVFHAPVNTSADPQYDFLNGGGTSGSACGTAGGNSFAPLGGINDRCGPGPRLPLLVISPWAKQNYIDHNFTDQSSVIKFIEENWGIGPLGHSAFESLSGLTSNGTQVAPGSSQSGDLMSMFDFHPKDGEVAPAVILNDQTGEVIRVVGQQGGEGEQGGEGQNGGDGQGDESGRQTIPGIAPHVVCSAVRNGRRVILHCVEVGTARDRARVAEARLIRGHTVVASGRGHLWRIRMQAHRRIRSGVYLLRITMRGAAPDTQVIVL